MSSRIIPLVNAARTNPDRTVASIYESLKTQYHGSTLHAFDKDI